MLELSVPTKIPSPKQNLPSNPVPPEKSWTECSCHIPGQGRAVHVPQTKDVGAQKCVPECQGEVAVITIYEMMLR